MADHIVKIKEVPKGKRLAYFWDYYKIHTIVAIILLVSLVSILKSTVFRTKEDAFILIAGTQPLIEDRITNIKNTINSFDIDVNGDKKVKVDLQNISFSNDVNDDQNMTDAQLEGTQMMKMAGVLSTGNYIIQIADENMTEYLISQGVAGKVSDFSKKYYTKDENYVKIPVSDTKLADSFGNFKDDYFIVVRGKDRVSSGSNKKNKNYERQLLVLDKLLK